MLNDGKTKKIHVAELGENFNTHLRICVIAVYPCLHWTNMATVIKVDWEKLSPLKFYPTRGP